MMANATTQSDLAHTPDYRSVRWGDETFYFTSTQAEIVEILDSWGCQGCPDVGEAYLLTEVDSEAKELRVLFRGNAAWNRLIVRGETNGSRRLACFPKKL